MKQSSTKPRLGYGSPTADPKRTPSASIAQLDPSQIRHLKEAFTYLQQEEPEQSEIHSLNFAQYLGIMSGLATGVSSKKDLMDAFSIFEEDGHEQQGRIRTAELKDMLLEMGMPESEIEMCFERFRKSGGMNGDWFYYRDFVELLTMSNATVPVS